MELSVGIDLVAISSVKDLLSKQAALRRVYTINEVQYCETKRNKYRYYAGYFAAKEAAMKALKTGWGSGVQWNHIEIISTGCQPAMQLHKVAKEEFEKAQFQSIGVSISHTNDLAIATVLFY